MNFKHIHYRKTDSTLAQNQGSFKQGWAFGPGSLNKSSLLILVVILSGF
jgi:hypothetical protein